MLEGPVTKEFLQLCSIVGRRQPMTQVQQVILVMRETIAHEGRIG